MNIYYLHKYFSKETEREMEQFMRIAQAKLRGTYKFAPQRLAVAAKMYTKWKNRQANEEGEKA